MQVDETTFFKTINCLELVPFEQTNAWKQFNEKGNVNFVYYIVNNSQNFPVAAFWGRVFKKPLIGKILDINGIAKSASATSKDVSGLFKEVSDSNVYDLILYNDVLPYDCANEVAMRRIGYNRPMGNRLCPLTILVDIKEERKCDRNWKRNLKKATDAGLTFRKVNNPSMQDSRLVSNMFGELAEMKSLGYKLDPEKLMCLLNDNHYHLFYVEKDLKPLCARIVYENGLHTADVFAANSFESRKYSATHYLCEEIFEYFNKRGGVETFDFSRIPPSNNETDSVYLFKASSGGRIVQYGGEWYFSKRNLLPLLFCIFNFYIRRTHHY